VSTRISAARRRRSSARRLAAADGPHVDAPGRRYAVGWGTSSRKLTGPASVASDLGAIDAVLLSHDDTPTTSTTPGGRHRRHDGQKGNERLGGYARGLRPWHVWAVLELTSRGWRGVVMTPRSVAEIERLGRRQQQLFDRGGGRRLASQRAEATPDSFTRLRDASRPPILARIGGYPWMRG
jgi:hypothetical protein